MGIPMRLPDFIGIGAPRCGTTWLSHLLNQHGEIYFDPNFIELHFFDNNYQRGLKWYSRFFKGIPNGIVCGDFTPGYMHQSNIIEKIKQMDPDVKLIMSIRDPAERAYSHYMQRKRFKNWTNDFDATVRNNADHILDYGEYGQQIDEIYKLFSPDQVHIVIFEELIAAPQKVLRELFKFLAVGDLDVDLSTAPRNQMTSVRFLWLKRLTRGIRSMSRKYYGVRKVWFGLLPGAGIIRFLRAMNVKGVESKAENMLPETKDFLTNYYADDRILLERLLNKTLSSWSK